MVEVSECFWKCSHLSVCFTPSVLNEVMYFGSTDLALPQHFVQRVVPGEGCENADPWQLKLLNALSCIWICPNTNCSCSQAECSKTNLCFPQVCPWSSHLATGTCEFLLLQQLQEFVKDPLRTEKSSATKSLFPF